MKLESFSCCFVNNHFFSNLCIKKKKKTTRNIAWTLIYLQPYSFFLKRKKPSTTRTNLFRFIFFCFSPTLLILCLTQTVGNKDNGIRGGGWCLLLNNYVIILAKKLLNNKQVYNFSFSFFLFIPLHPGFCSFSSSSLPPSLSIAITHTHITDSYFVVTT